MNVADFLGAAGAVAVSVLAFAVLLAAIVFVHEFGHFAMARACGVKVEVFSIGFGRPFLTWTDRHGTEWRVAWIPLGGFVRFFGDANEASEPEEAHAADDRPLTTQFPRPGDEARGLSPEDKRRSFHFKPVWQRALIVAAGPLSNFVLATAIFWALFLAFGLRAPAPIIGDVAKGSAAEAAGLRKGDEILSVDGVRIETFNDLAQIVVLSAGEELDLVVRRDGADVAVKATPRRSERTDGFGNPVRAGLLGITASDKEIVRHFGPVEALRPALGQVAGVVSGTVKFLGRLVQGKEDASQLGGPIKMAKYSGQALLFGFNPANFANGQAPGFLEALGIGLQFFVNLAAVVSVSIGFLNLLPVPVLDGGHLMYYAYEAATGRPLGAKLQAAGFRIGMVLLVSFMLFVTWNDIKSLFS